MKKLLFISLAMLFVSAMFIPQAMTKSHKVEYCHLTDWVKIPQNEWTLAVGHVISMSKNAARSHKSHNDFEYNPVFGIDEPSGIGPLTWREVAEVWGLDLDGVECAGFLVDESF
jgi:hypothetical protein